MFYTNVEIEEIAVLPLAHCIEHSEDINLEAGKAGRQAGRAEQSRAALEIERWGVHGISLWVPTFTAP